MKTQLIMLPQPILVSDEEIKQGDFRFMIDNQSILYGQYEKHTGTYECNNQWAKIIAGIPELPSIDFSALSEEDCKRIGWVDVEKLALKECVCNTGDCVHVKSYTIGFKAAQSLNEKKCSESKLLDWIEKNKYTWGKYNGNTAVSYDELKLFIQSQSQPKSFEIEVEMEDSKIVEKHEFDGTNDGEITWVKQPKINNNSIKILRVITQLYL